MTCRHRNASWSKWDGTAWVDVGSLHGPPLRNLQGFDRVVCLDCGEWLGLGEANDSPDVLDEIRAAEIQYEGRLLGLLIQDPEPWRQSAAGYLAGCIATHDYYGGPK